MLLLQTGRELLTEGGELLLTEENPMATWANLTQEQRDVYLTFENDLRSLCGEWQRLNAKFASLDARYVSQLQAILVDLDNNTIVPKSNGLAGSSSLDSDAEMVTLVSHYQGMLTTYNTASHQQMRAKACGQANMT